MRKSWKNYNTLEDIQGFIDENEIKSCSEFNRNYGGLSRRMIRLGLLQGDLHFPTYNQKTKKTKWEDFNTLEDVQGFIGSRGIKSCSEFAENYAGLVKRMSRLKISLSKLTFPTYRKKTEKTKWEDYNTLEDIQSFIDSEGIQSFTEFKTLYGGLSRRVSKLGFSLSDLNFPTYNQRTIKTRWEDYNTIEDIQNFIDENEIKNCSEFNEKYGGLVAKISRLDFSLSDLRFPEQQGSWKSYNTLEDIQGFIDSMGIRNCTEFDKNYAGLSRRLNKLGFSLSDLRFSNFRKSILERDIESFLLDNSIRFEKQKTFSELGKLRFDFYLPDYEIILEPGGDHHLIPIEAWGGEECFKVTRKHDIKKKEFCESRGYTILYMFRFCRKESYEVLEKEGYLGAEYYIDLEEYFEKILNLIEEKKKG